MRIIAISTVTAAALGIGLASAFAGPTVTPAAQPAVGLGTAAPFAVLAGTTVTNTGPSIISGDLGVSPGTAITGFPPGIVINGTEHAADAVALQAQNDLTTAYNDAAGRTPATGVSTDLGGQTLTAGVYQSAAALALTGTVTLDGQNDPNAVFIFQAGSTLTTAPNSTVALINGAQACNVYWQVGSSSTLGTNTTFVGSVLALTSISAQTGTTVSGRLLARNGQVSLDTNTITRPTCSIASPSPSASVTPSGGPSATPTPTPTPTLTPSGTPTVIPSGTPTITPSGTPTGTPTGMPSGTPSTSPTGGGYGSPSATPTGTGYGGGYGSPSSSPTGIGYGGYNSPSATAPSAGGYEYRGR